MPDTAYDRLLAYRRALPRTPPIQRQTVRVNGLALAVFTTPPVVGRVPLVGVNGGMVFDHSMLWPALAPLARDRQIILFDLRGRGASQAPLRPEDTRIADDAGDVVSLRRALGIRQWDVLGHSWGGGISVLAAAADTAGVRRLVTVDAVGPTSEWIPQVRIGALQRLSGPARTALESIGEDELLVADARIHSAYAGAMYPAWFSDDSLVSRFTLPEQLSPAGAAALARLRRDGYDWRVELRAVSAPTLVIHGTLDPLPVETAHQLAIAIPTAQLSLLPSGHMPFWERPAEFFSLVEHFLTTPNPRALVHTHS